MKPEEDYSPEQLAALRTVRKLVEFWQISLHELRGPMALAPPPPPAGPVAIRYRHPVSGETWDGQGEHPPWLRDALLKEGYTVDELKRAVADPAGAAVSGQPPEAGVGTPSDGHEPPASDDD
ncbi:MAG TPA: H-NS family nucleoid-associated regulatory protein, partial [Burkholderiaceae bacterium]|nr:H-NS family nucleoid-associated regulatory protein [Burkholderiaceae bacterium]